MKKFYLSVILSTALISAFAQSRYTQKMDLQLRAYLAKPTAGVEMIDLFVHGEKDAVSAAVKAVGGQVKLTLPRLVSARVPVARVAELAEAPAVHHFEFSLERGHLMNDSMRVKNRVDLVHAGQAPLHQGYDGTGVVLGFIDSGLDILHPDFRDANDNSRVYRYWDQVPSANPGSPAPFGYGTEWTTAELEAGGSSIPNDNASGHGTTVMGTAAGNGLANGRHKGVASGADIIAVATNFGSPNWSSTVADGVAYILAQAEALGKPAVINASLGSYGGSHDGKDAAALFIEDLLDQQGGRAMVAAAGNSNSEFPYHLRTEVDADTTFTWFTTNQNTDPRYNAFPFPNMFFELWADADDFADVQFAIGADRVTPTLAYRGRTVYHTVADAIGTTVTEPLISSSGNTLGTVQYYAQERGDQILLQVMMESPDSASYLWRFMTTGSGIFDVWSLTTRTATSNVIGPTLAQPLGLPFPSAAEYPAMATYVEPDKRKHMVDSWACLPNVITVANYCNEVAYTDYAGNQQTVPGTEQDIAPNSSAGPTRDERLKPDIASTGDVTFTAGPLVAIQWIIDNQNGWKIDPGGMHVRDGGTSMAAPVVAGTAALYLQKCPDATPQEILQAVQATARADEFTGPVPNNRWGMGKLDAFATMVNRVELSAESTTFCEGQAMVVEVPDGFTDVEWSNGSMENPLQLTEAGELSAVLHTPSGCLAYTDTLTFTTLPSPAVPTIDVDGFTLTSSTAPAYQWYWNGSPLEGAVEQTLEAPLGGIYRVEVIAANGCSTFSDEAGITILGLPEGRASAFAVWPSPAQDHVRVQLPPWSTGGAVLTIIASDGRIVHQERATGATPMTLAVNGLAAGTYMLQAQVGEDRWSQRFVKMP
ncbi:MAG TPA: S8 family peptidase [Flavobacteriales bacterium]|nr:S8 family peptidase [Flavobacteriales bacterium]